MNFLDKFNELKIWGNHPLEWMTAGILAFMLIVSII